MVTRKWISPALGLLLAAATAPAMAQSANQQVANQVAESLRGSQGLAASRITIEARGGLVTLAGVVPAEGLKTEAIARAQQVAGVQGVIDRLTVGDPRVLPARYAADAAQPRVALGGHLSSLGGQPILGNGGVMGGEVNNGFVSGGTVMDGAAMGGPMPEGPAGLTGPSQAAMPGYPNYAWPSYAPYPNFSAVGYPTVYPWQAFPNIGPFYPYPEVPLDWRAVTLRWDDGLWWLDFKKHYTRPFFTPYPFGLFAY
jgi:hypothetical protein